MGGGSEIHLLLWHECLLDAPKKSKRRRKAGIPQLIHLTEERRRHDCRFGDIPVLWKTINPVEFCLSLLTKKHRGKGSANREVKDTFYDQITGSTAGMWSPHG